MLMTASGVRDPDEGVYGFVAFATLTIPFVYQHGGRIVDDWHAPLRTTFDDPLTIEAIEWYADLALEYGVMPSPQEAETLYGNGGNPAYVFWRRKAGLYLGFLSDRGGESWGDQDWQMEWGAVPLPVDQQAATIGYGHAYAVLSDAQEPDACWEWLTYLSEQMPAYAMPARRSLAESEAFERRVGYEIASAALDSVEHALLYTDAQAALGRELERYTQAVVAITNGDLPAKEALSQLQMESAPPSP